MNFTISQCAFSFGEGLSAAPTAKRMQLNSFMFEEKCSRIRGTGFNFSLLWVNVLSLARSSVVSFDFFFPWKHCIFNFSWQTWGTFLAKCQHFSNIRIKPCFVRFLSKTLWWLSSKHMISTCRWLFLIEPSHFWQVLHFRWALLQGAPLVVTHQQLPAAFFVKETHFRCF